MMHFLSYCDHVYMLYMLSVQLLHQRQGTASKNKGIPIPLSFLFHEQTISGRKRGWAVACLC